MTHQLDCWPLYFQPMLDEMKRFEIRERRDRNFQIGDVLLLLEYDQEKGYTGRHCKRLVTYLTDFEQKPGFVVMSLAAL